MTHAPTPNRPRLVATKGVGFRWGLPDGWVGHVDQDAGLRAMCDYGAARFHEDYCDHVNFDCMPVEVDRIKSYMAKYHPGVSYSTGPAGQALARANAAWEAAQEDTNVTTEMKHG